MPETWLACGDTDQCTATTVHLYELERDSAYSTISQCQLITGNAGNRDGGNDCKEGGDECSRDLVYSCDVCTDKGCVGEEACTDKVDLPAQNVMVNDCDGAKIACDGLVIILVIQLG